MTGNLDFYPCKYDRAFKEVFLNPNNKDLLKALLETISHLEMLHMYLIYINLNI